jgi:hypothetical protein
MDANLRIAAIPERLKAAKAKDTWPFGAEIHCFRLDPVLPEAEVAEFENRWRIQIPMEYRAFITQLGNGGAGPAYGLLALEEGVSYRGFTLPDDFLQSPFPFLAAYNPYEDPRLSEYWQRSGSGQVRKEEYEARKLKEITGTLVCAMRAVAICISL